MAIDPINKSFEQDKEELVKLRIDGSLQNNESDDYNKDKNGDIERFIGSSIANFANYSRDIDDIKKDVRDLKKNINLLNISAYSTVAAIIVASAILTFFLDMDKVKNLLLGLF